MSQIQSYFVPFYGTTTNAVQVKSGQGQLHGIFVGSTVVGGITLADTLAGTTSIIMQLSAGTPAGSYVIDANFTNGLRVTPTGTNVFTVTYL